MIKVSGCRVLVKPQTLAEHDKGIARAKDIGLIIPEFSERKEQINVDKGTILQIGSKCHEDYIGDAKVGDTIGYAKFGGKFMTDPITDEIYLVIQDEDVICVFDNE